MGITQPGRGPSLPWASVSLACRVTFVQTKSMCTCSCPASPSPTPRFILRRKPYGNWEWACACERNTGSESRAAGPACLSLSLVCWLLHVLFFLPSIFFVEARLAFLASARFSLEWDMWYKKKKKIPRNGLLVGSASPCSMTQWALSLGKGSVQWPVWTPKRTKRWPSEAAPHSGEGAVWGVGEGAEQSLRPYLRSAELTFFSDSEFMLGKHGGWVCPSITVKWSGTSLEGIGWVAAAGKHPGTQRSHCGPWLPLQKLGRALESPLLACPTQRHLPPRFPGTLCCRERSLCLLPITPFSLPRRLFISRPHPTLAPNCEIVL